MGKLPYDPRLVPEGPWALRLARWLGRRQLRTMTRCGLPESLRGPLEFLLERTIPGGDYGPLDRAEALRAELARRDGTLTTFDHVKATGVAPAKTRRTDEARPLERSSRDVAYGSSVTAVWGTFLYLCATAARARTIVELGTAAGISGSYLGSAPSCRRFITVEGDAGRARLAEANLRPFIPHVEVLNTTFEAALDSLLTHLHDGIDMAFIDGQKTRGSYVALLDRLAPRLNPGALVVFDDIQWFDVQQDWQSIATRPSLSFVINTGRFGVCIWDPASARPKAFTLYGLAGLDVYQIRRDMAAYLRR